MSPTTGFDIFQGFSQRASEEREAVRQQEALRDARELRVLETLMSSDDPEIASRALAGMLQFADPRVKRKGLAGFLGETEGHPALPAIAALLGPSTRDYSMRAQAGVPSGALHTPPPAQGAAAMPGGSAVTGSPISLPSPFPGAIPMVAPPPRPQTTGEVAAQAPPAPTGLSGGPPPAPPVTHTPRRAFLSPEERALRQTKAKAQGDVEGEVAGLIAAGFTDQEARELVKQSYQKRVGAGRGIPGMQRVAIELADGSQHMAVFDPVTGKFNDPDTGQPFENARPLQRTGSTSLGATREALARELFGKRASALTPEEMAQVNDAEVTRAGEVSYARGTATGQAANETKLNAPLTPEQAAVQGMPVGSSMASFEGIVPLSIDQRGRLDAAKALAPQIDQMDVLIQRVFPPSSGLTGGITAAAVLAQKRLGRDPEIEQLDALVAMSLGNVARVLAAESGRLTEQDAQRAQRALVDLKVSLVNGDTQETAIAKVRVVQDALRRIGLDLKSPGQQLGYEKEIPTSPRGLGSAPPPGPTQQLQQGPPPGAPPPAAAPGGPPAQAAPPANAGIAQIGQVVYDAAGRRGVVREVLPDGKMRVAWEVK